MMKSKTRTTMADVASRAGVSRTTAARVVNNKGYVSTENRQKVLKAVSESGYRPNQQARSLRAQRSFTVGLVLSSARSNPFFTNISHAVRTALADAGYSLLTINHGQSNAVEVQGVKQFLEHRVEAIILCHPYRIVNYLPIIAAGIPIIQIERNSVDSAGRIELDAGPGMSQAIHLLKRAGHRRISFLAGTTEAADPAVEDKRPEDDRIVAFQKAIMQAELSLDDCPIRQVRYYATSDNGMLAGYHETRGLLETAGPRPTAIVAGSDTLAGGVLQALYDLRLRVPDDISLVGYDNSLAQFLTPPLTSIAQPYREIGIAVTEMVTDLHEVNKKRVRTIATSLHERLSVGPAPSQS